MIQRLVGIPKRWSRRGSTNRAPNVCVKIAGRSRLLQGSDRCRPFVGGVPPPIGACRTSVRHSTVTCALGPRNRGSRERHRWAPSGRSRRARTLGGTTPRRGRDESAQGHAPDADGAPHDDGPARSRSCRPFRARPDVTAATPGSRSCGIRPRSPRRLRRSSRIGDPCPGAGRCP